MITYPLNNIDFSAEDVELYHCTRTSGVYDGDSFSVSVTGLDNDITVGVGIAWIRNSYFSGKVIANKESVVLSPELADAIYPRIDAVVIRFDANANSTSIVMKTGVPASTPVPPEVIRTETVYELHRYHIYREAGATVVSESDLIDLKHNAEYCGIMHDSVSSVDNTLSMPGYAADAAAVGEAMAGAKNGIKFIKVWENASPSSSLSPQTVSLDLSDADSIKIVYKASTTGTTRYTEEVAVGDRIQLFAFANVGVSGSVEMYARGANTSVTGVEFEKATQKGITSTSVETDNKQVIPLRIYAVKGVQK